MTLCRFWNQIYQESCSVNHIFQIKIDYFLWKQFTRSKFATYLTTLLVHNKRLELPTLYMPVFAQGQIVF